MYETFVYKILMFLKAYLSVLLKLIIFIFFVGTIGIIFVGIPYYFIQNDMKIIGGIFIILFLCIFPALKEFNGRGP